MAVAHHVAGNLQLAIDVLDAHESSIEVRTASPLAAEVDVLSLRHGHGTAESPA